jgi:Bacterial PH domain
MRILDVDQVAPSEAPGLTDHLIDGEEVHAAFVSATGLLLFTEIRILIVQREHLIDERLETMSYPYRELRHFSITEGREAGTRCALRIWLGAEPQPLHLRANDAADLAGVHRLLAAKLA